MSDFDRNARPAGGRRRPGRARRNRPGPALLMLGVYNNMVLGLAVTGLVALGVNMLAVTATRRRRPRRWAALCSRPSALRSTSARCAGWSCWRRWHSCSSFRSESTRWRRRRHAALFFVFAAAMGLSLSSILLDLYRNLGRPRLLHHRRGLRRPEPLRLHDDGAICADGLLPDHGLLRARLSRGWSTFSLQSSGLPVRLSCSRY